MDLTTNKILREYTSNDLRISLVYRARCFRSEEDKLKYKSYPPISIEQILNIFINDLVISHKYSLELLNKMSRLDLGLLIMNTYIKYPLPSVEESIIPMNYCALPILFPWTENIIKLFCK